MGNASYVDVGGVEDFADGVPTIVTVGGRKVVVVHWNGEFYGLRNVCPHQTQSFERGGVYFQLAPGERLGEMVVSDTPVIACPWHTWSFNLRNGQCTVDPKLRVRAYTVTVQDGRVLVSTGESSRALVAASARESRGDG
jgi:3-phenylpropionate/trans-cinnamate dioxygenase ferredoxin subunit